MTALDRAAPAFRGTHATVHWRVRVPEDVRTIPHGIAGRKPAPTEGSTGTAEAPRTQRCTRTRVCAPVPAPYTVCMYRDPTPKGRARSLGLVGQFDAGRGTSIYSALRMVFAAYLDKRSMCRPLPAPIGSLSVALAAMATVACGSAEPTGATSSAAAHSGTAGSFSGATGNDTLPMGNAGSVAAAGGSVATAGSGGFTSEPGSGGTAGDGSSGVAGASSRGGATLSAGGSSSGGSGATAGGGGDDSGGTGGSTGTARAGGDGSGGSGGGGGAGGSATSDCQGGKVVHFVYFVEADQQFSEAQRDDIERHAFAFQRYWYEQLGVTFYLNDPVVDVIEADHDSTWYVQTPDGIHNEERWYRLGNVKSEVYDKLGITNFDDDHRVVSYPITRHDGRVGGNFGGAWMDGDDLSCIADDGPTYPYDDGNGAHCMGHPVHEFGHVLGLDHEGPNEDCMQFGFYLGTGGSGMCDLSDANVAKILADPDNEGWFEALPGETCVP